MPRQQLRPQDATNEGVRQLREALLRMSSAVLARQLACDASHVRRIARETRIPSPALRERLHRVLGTPFTAWETAPVKDAYVDEPSPTRQRR